MNKKKSIQKLIEKIIQLQKKEIVCNTKYVEQITIKKTRYLSK